MFAKDLGESLSNRVIEDIIMPVLNVAAIQPLKAYCEAENGMKAFVSKLQENMHDIHFYTSLQHLLF